MAPLTSIVPHKPTKAKRLIQKASMEFTVLKNLLFFKFMNFTHLFLLLGPTVHAGDYRDYKGLETI